MDWSVLEKIGIAGVAVVGFWIMYQVFILFMKQWGASTEALNRNSESYEQLSRVFGQAHERELEFHREMMHVSNDTNRKVTELHREFLEKRQQRNLQ